MPFLGKLPEWLNPSIKSVRHRREKEEKLWKGLMKQVRQEMDNGTANVSYARTYFERKEAEKGSRAFGFEDTEAAYAVGMLCTVAIFTIGGPLYCFFLAMVLHPEWQEKVRKEIDEKIGDRIVEVSDSPDLPILRAVIKECIRWRPPVPLGKLFTIHKSPKSLTYRSRCPTSPGRGRRVQWLLSSQRRRHPCRRSCPRA